MANQLAAAKWAAKASVYAEARGGAVSQKHGLHAYAAWSHPTQVPYRPGCSKPLASALGGNDQPLVAMGRQPAAGPPAEAKALAKAAASPEPEAIAVASARAGGWPHCTGASHPQAVPLPGQHR
jgi:hypothetical protein